ncbi:DUF2934 domain-containing protein [Mesorhizobium sp.]|uniref:DUF2934 domain-containing protein n=1 Tax=Mesorhizobium sp. TaxID=1871066 RepID=UPI000FE3947E|nr:DUF2934 domain-containing protein [Mesorhizobium sp.]RWH68508.1 MAG: DUF2934 domain-containing protein [Mesorhizobium sp.]RWL24847.1 MAG: DUF2934 domain-containing protein [Mesorhizobium sp.]RWL27222.1 MAG: DUF2934 domain-containing protein [Mesorhizobium sp.]RWL31511.1 MAG: DUF2934 domain-containing protein [Mesorhizobium sp.]RWL51078.1 MAG: DUF2934 domain-containing protein [Mesorhizobium sp.]
MATDKYERIQRRAYEIWKHSGEGHGQHEEHWRQAREEIEREDKGFGEQPGAAMPGAVTIPVGQPDPLAAEALARKATSNRPEGPADDPARTKRSRRKG